MSDSIIKGFIIEDKNNSEGEQQLKIKPSSSTKSRQRLIQLGSGVLFLKGYYDLFQPMIESVSQLYFLCFSYMLASVIIIAKLQTGLNQLRSIQPAMVNYLRQEGFVIEKIFEAIQPTYSVWRQYVFATIVLALLHWKIIYLTESPSIYAYLIVGIDVVKILSFYPLMKYYRRKKSHFNHLVGDYALEQKLKQTTVS